MRRNDLLMGLLFFACIVAARLINPQTYPWVADWGLHLVWFLAGGAGTFLFWKKNREFHFHLLGYLAAMLFAFAQIAKLSNLSPVDATWVYVASFIAAYALRPLEAIKN